MKFILVDKRSLTLSQFYGLRGGNKVDLKDWKFGLYFQHFIIKDPHVKQQTECDGKCEFYQIVIVYCTEYAERSIGNTSCSMTLIFHLDFLT